MISSTMDDIVKNHAKQVKRKVAGQPNCRQAFVTETLLDAGPDGVVPGHPQKLTLC